MKIIIPFTKHKLLFKPEIAVETKTEKYVLLIITLHYNLQMSGNRKIIFEIIVNE